MEQLLIICIHISNVKKTYFIVEGIQETVPFPGGYILAVFFMDASIQPFILPIIKVNRSKTMFRKHSRIVSYWQIVLSDSGVIKTITCIRILSE